MARAAQQTEGERMRIHRANQATTNSRQGQRQTALSPHPIERHDSAGRANIPVDSVASSRTRVGQATGSIPAATAKNRAPTTFVGVCAKL